MFANKKPEPTSYTGQTWIQQSLKARRNAAAIAKELGVAKHVLEQFVAGQSVPPDKVLQALATYLTGGHGEYVPELNLMRSVNRAEPTPMGVKPPPIVPPKVEYVVGGMNGVGPQPVKPEKPKAKPHRPGWAQ